MAHIRNGDDDNKSFSCRVENVKSITDILNCLCIDLTKGQHCDVEATPDSKNMKSTSQITFYSMYSHFNVFLLRLCSSVLHCDWEGKGNTGRQASINNCRHNCIQRHCLLCMRIVGAGGLPSRDIRGVHMRQREREVCDQPHDPHRLPALVRNVVRDHHSHHVLLGTAAIIQLISSILSSAGN